MFNLLRGLLVLCFLLGMSGVGIARTQQNPFTGKPDYTQSDVQDEGVSKGNAGIINFVGNNVVAAVSGDTGTITISDQTTTLSGDVSGSGTTSIATTIGANKVTLAMMANMATASLLGRNTAGTGIPEVITDIPTASTIGSAYIYRAGGTDIVVADGGSGASTLTGLLIGNGTSAFTATTVSSGVSGQITDETGTGVMVFGTTPTFTTSIIDPLIIGGTATTSDLSLQTTSGVGASGADMHFLVGNNGATEAMTILNSGYVGIGATAPGTRLEVGANGSANEIITVKSQGNAGIELLGDTDNDASEVGTGYAVFGQDNIAHTIIGTIQAAGVDSKGTSYTGSLINAFLIGTSSVIGSGAGHIQFGTRGAVRMTVDDTGNVGIGTTSPSTNLHLVGNPSDANIFIDRYSSDAISPYIVSRKARGTSASPTQVLANDDIGGMFARGYHSGSGFGANNVAAIKFIADGNFTSTSQPTYIVFGTTPSGSITRAEQMRIDSAGNVGIGTTAPTNLLSLGGNSARIFWMERHTTAGTAGNNLTVTAGGATSGATDKNAGDLILTSGTSTGTGGGAIQFQTSQAAASTATTDNALTTRFKINNNGHLISSGTVPTIANNDCGTTAQGTVTTLSTDVSGSITVGTLTVTSCAMTFAKAWTNAPNCVVIDDTNVLAVKASTSTTKLTITSSTSMSSDVISFVCIGNE